MPSSGRERIDILDSFDWECQWINPATGEKCRQYASEVHHIEPKGMGGRHGEAKKQSESRANKEPRCRLHNHSFYSPEEDRYYMGHSK